MPDPIPGICGFSRNKCKISWVSQYPNKVGVYPSQCLPSTYTIWRAVFDTQIPNAPPLILPGDTGLGFLGGGAGLAGEMGVPNLGQVKTFQSHHIVIFAKTANRLNSPHTLTDDELKSGTINVGEYVFEVVAVTPLSQTIDTQLSQADIDRIKRTGESESDRAFRKLFEQDIKGNIFKNIIPNKYGIEYRMDNGTDKASMALDSAGEGDLRSASYRDGTSKIIQFDTTAEVDFPKSGGQPNETEKRKAKAGDVVYITYVGVVKHYIRQQVNVVWTVVDGGSTLQCYTYPVGFKVTHYRFYEWQMAKLKSTDSPTTLGGWRIVESFNARPNFIALMDGPTVELGEVGIGGDEGIGSNQALQYMPGNITLQRLDDLMTNRTKMPRYTLEYNRKTGQCNYHLDAGANGQRDAYKSANWFRNGAPGAFIRYFDIIKHVYFNVHPKTMQVRDVDKFGIELSVAQALEKDIQANRNTYFPFLDNPNLLPDRTIGTCPCNGSSKDDPYLNSGNAKFEPIIPVSEYGGNASAQCGSVGSFGLWGFLGNPQQGLTSFHAWESNFIREKFDVGTRVLVERNFSAWETGPLFITIECAGGGVSGVSCITDSQLVSSYAAHINSDSFMLFNKFNHGYAKESVTTLPFRPDVSVPATSQDPKVTDVEDLTGLSRLSGSRLDAQPGVLISLGGPASTSLIYKTTDPTLITNPDATIETITYTQTNDKITIPVGSGYYGKLDLSYALKKKSDNPNVLVLYKTGETLQGAISGLTISGQQIFSASPNWIRADTIEISGPVVANISVVSITILSLDDSKAKDFLTNHSNPADVTRVFLDGSILLETDIQSLAKDSSDKIYNFFNDKNNGISMIRTPDGGFKWELQYGLAEAIEGNETRNPFVLSVISDDSCYLFYDFMSRVLCKHIPLYMVESQDANLVEKYEDIYTAADPANNKLATRKSSIYTIDGQIIRRELLAHVALGNIIDDGFTKYIDVFEDQLIESKTSGGSTTTEKKNVRKYPVSLGPLTAFANQNMSSPYFSVYRNARGVMRLFFLAPVQNTGDYSKGEGGGSTQLQCHFSTDNGINWFDQWEYINHGYTRLATKDGRSFIDLGSGQPEALPAVFGLNIHWSRLPADQIKVPGGNTEETDSKIIDIDSPYAFYHAATKTIFIFYVYKGLLLCKYFPESLFDDLKLQEDGMRKLKDIIEKQTPSHFVDGYLDQTDLKPEIDVGNIIFQYANSIKNFGTTRTIDPHRVCAYSDANGNIRVIYKMNSSPNLKAALWDGQRWAAEEFLSSSLNAFNP